MIILLYHRILRDVDEDPYFPHGVVTLKEFESQGLTGVVVGRALYEGKLDLRKAVEICSPNESSPASISGPAGSSKGSGS